MLNCGLHKCPQKCHQLHDHSKMPCEFVLSIKCPVGHDQTWKCHVNPPKSCRRCEKDAAEEERKKKRALELKEKREKAAREHDEKMARLNEQIEAQRQAVQDERLAQERQIALQQRQKDLANLANVPQIPRAQSPPHPKAPDSSEPEIRPPHAMKGAHDMSTKPAEDPRRTTSTKPAESPRQTSSTSTKDSMPADSPSKLEWERQKSIEKASNSAIDSLMDMVGLEDVKRQVLAIKAKIDTYQRQNSDVKDERFNISLLGNPGTGEEFSVAHSALALFANSEITKVKRLLLGFTPKS